ncbi:MAG: histidine kinase [Chitinophagaceae bacterium]
MSTANRTISFLILFFSVTNKLIAQDNCGCKEAEQLRAPMSLHFNSGQLDSAEFYTRKLLTFKEGGCKVYFQNWMAQISLGKKDYANTRLYIDAEAKLLKEKNCDQELYVRHYSILAKLYQELNIFDSLVSTCLNGIEASQKANDYYGLSRANTDLAAAFSQMGQYGKAIMYYRRGLDAAKKQTKSPTLVALVQTRLSSQYLSGFEKSGNTVYADSAAWLAKDALDSAAKYHDLLAFLEANEALASHALLTNNDKSAIQFADVIINTSPKGVHLLDRLIYAGFSKKSEAFLKLKDCASAERFADSALLYAQAFNPQMMIGAYENIYNAAKANNNMSKSLAAHEKMVLLKDSLFTLEKNTSISELEKKYNQVKNENTIKDLAKKKQLYLLLAIAGLLGLTAVTLFLRQQSLKHKKNILETEQRLNRARMNPHFFFNALTTLQKFALRENDGQAMASNLSRFSNIMRETLESTYKEYVTVEQETEFLNEYLEVQKIRFPKTFSYNIVTEKGLEIDEILIPSMIIQPFIENSIEHGFVGIDHPGNITVNFRKEKQEILIEIKDNGKGLAVSHKEAGEHISRASQIIKDRIYLLNIKLKTKAGFSIANNEQESGVLVKIHLPLIYKEQ